VPEQRPHGAEAEADDRAERQRELLEKHERAQASGEGSSGRYIDV
jgi:hypothetical protein